MLTPKNSPEGWHLTVCSCCTYCVQNPWVLATPEQSWSQYTYVVVQKVSASLHLRDICCLLWIAPDEHKPAVTFLQSCLVPMSVVKGAIHKHILHWIELSYSHSFCIRTNQIFFKSSFFFSIDRLITQMCTLIFWLFITARESFLFWKFWLKEHFRSKSTIL